MAFLVATYRNIPALLREAIQRLQAGSLPFCHTPYPSLTAAAFVVVPELYYAEKYCIGALPSEILRRTGPA